MKKYILLFIILITLTGCKKVKEDVKKNITYDRDRHEYNCDYVNIFEDDKLSFRSFCSPVFYLGENEDAISLNEAFNKNVINIDSVLDGLEIVETHKNGDLELKDLDNTYFIYKCNSKTEDGKDKIIISVLGYGEEICML